MCLKTDDTLWTWGLNDAGQLGQNDTIDRSSPVQVGTNWAVVKGGSYANRVVVAVTNDGKLFSWGYGAQGTLGNLSTANRSSPVQVGALTNWKTLAVNQHFAACVKTDGTLWTWGRNNQGQLGSNNTITRSSPVQVGALTNWAIPSGGTPNIMCSKIDNTIWSWGKNNYGQLGLGNTTYRSSPVQIGSSDNWISISAGANHGSALEQL
jgi:alpha-tubulin suppressor-like RCC1 family protein